MNTAKYFMFGVLIIVSFPLWFPILILGNIAVDLGKVVCGNDSDSSEGW